MRVVDGMHRVQVARLRGEESISVAFVEGTEDELFVLAVSANIDHGLPLSRVDREAAAVRILRAYPHWSDRAIAEVTGLAAKKIKQVRERASAELPHLDARIGRDGRARPSNSAERRRQASEVILANPGASLREVARIVGISPGTVRDVRRRMLRGEDPVPERRQITAAQPAADLPVPSAVLTTDDLVTIVRSMSQDPALRFSATGRTLLRVLHGNATIRDTWHEFVRAVPEHRVEDVAHLARGCAEELRRFADALERRQRNQVRDDRP